MNDVAPLSSPVHSAFPSLSYRDILRTWWPLAASWLLMSVEGPAISAVVARLADPEIHLASYGGLVFPVALLIEAPIIMLLAASTALCRDLPSYRRVRFFAHVTSAVLTLLHIAVACTPLYYVVATDIIHAPAEIVGPSRAGLIIMIPWTWAIAYRRMNQGVLIRFGRSIAVGTGTLVRLTADAAVLTLGYVVGSIPGIVVASSAMIVGVVAEALYVRAQVRPVLRTKLSPTSLGHILTTRGFLNFYVPLSLTSVLAFLASPMGSASLSRMPRSLESLAVWPVVTGIAFLLRSLGLSYNEVVVALLEAPDGSRVLRKFARTLVWVSTLGILLFAVPPLGTFWFDWVIGLAPSLAHLAQTGLWLTLPLPALSVLQSWYQGNILLTRRTRSITEAVVVYLVLITLVFVAGIWWQGVTGLYVGLAAFSIGELFRTAWLRRGSRRARGYVRA